MSDGESTTPAPRRRPTYGRPAPTSPAPTGGETLPSGNDGFSPSGAYGQPSAEQSAPSWGSPVGAPAGGPSAASAPGDFTPVTGPLPSQPAGSPGPRKRRGLWPLIIGLVLLLIIGPLFTIGGIVWGFSSMVGETSAQPTVIEGGSGEYELSAHEMLILYVPTEDAAQAQCTAEGSSANAVSTVPTSGSVTFGDGTSYEQQMGVAALEDTTVTITCTGTEAPAFQGPYDIFGVAAPMLIGPIIGIVAGLIGLVLTIVGIVLLVRSRRS